MTAHRIRRSTAFVAFVTLGVIPAHAQLLSGGEVRAGVDAYTWSAKMTCGTTEAGVTRYGMWEGKLYSRTPGERDRHLFNVFGINTRQCAQLSDPVRGPGYRSVSREIMVYLDPKTNEIVDEWANPWTGETVRVIHVANDPVNMRAPSHAKREDGSPARVELRRYGDTLVASNEVPLFYTNPLAGDYQEYVGGRYHAMEIFNTFYRTEDFLDAKRTRIGESRISWQRLSAWLPWMKMGERPGLMVFNATGFSTFDRDKIPPRLMEVLTTRFPEYLSPPPLDDARPNETTWTITKDAIDAERARKAE
jgi:hypothetical protein